MANENKQAQADEELINIDKEQATEADEKETKKKKTSKQNIVKHAPRSIVEKRRKTCQ